MMKKVQLWIQQKGFKSLALLGVGLGIFLLLGFSNVAWFVSGGCLTLFCYINWQPIKDLSELDEQAVIIYQKVKVETVREWHETKAELEEKYRQLEEKLKEFVNDQVKPFKDSK